PVSPTLCHSFPTRRSSDLFSYPSWRGGFYPEKAKPAEFLSFFSERLPSVELNTTFYGLPAEEQFRGWAAATPSEFRFAVKMSRRDRKSTRLNSSHLGTSYA